MARLTRRLLLGWVLYGALTLATLLLLLWYKGVFLPCRSSRTVQTELGGRPYTLTLENGAFAVQDGATTLWRSETALRVQDFLTLDIDRDGETELVLLVWRRGNYGPSKPFWVRRNDTNWSQHLFIYNWQTAPLPRNGCPARCARRSRPGPRNRTASCRSPRRKTNRRCGVGASGGWCAPTYDE